MGKARFLVVGTASLRVLDPGQYVRHIKDDWIVQCD